jgi:hypothetical protein
MSYGNSEGIPIRTGTVAGVVAFLVGLLVTFLVGALGVSRGLSFLVGLAPLQGAIVGFSSFHLWPLVLGGSTGLSPVWTLVPVVVLVLAGYLTVFTAGRSSNGFRDGASVAVGYFGLTVVAFLLSFVDGGGGQLGQVLVGVLFTGVLFPVVFGGVGGAVAGAG